MAAPWTVTGLADAIPPRGENETVRCRCASGDTTDSTLGHRCAGRGLEDLLRGEGSQPLRPRRTGTDVARRIANAFSLTLAML